MKIGVSNDPLQRLADIAAGCPLELGVLATTMFPSRGIAFRAENSLQRAFDEYHQRGGWFCFTPNEKAFFNSTLAQSLSEFSSPSAPIRWTKVNVQAYLEHQRTLVRQRQRVFAKRGKSFRDFVSDGGQPIR